MRNVIVIALLFACGLGCGILTKSQGSSGLKVHLRWSKAFPTHSKLQVEQGLYWALSYLGAHLPPDEAADLLIWNGENTIILNLAKAGFSQRSLATWKVIIARIQTSDEYRMLGSIDIGRFILLTLNSTWHYYALTGMPERLTDFLENHEFDDPVRFNEGESSVALGKREIHLPSNRHEDTHKLAFYAVEGRDSADQFFPEEFEVFDYMPNGQPRFGIYSLDGYLKNGANPRLGTGGKPAKCMWCHESAVLHSVKRKLRPEHQAFNVLTKELQANLFAHQVGLSTMIDYDTLDQHRKAEYLYASVMESTPIHISEEFKVPIDSVRMFLKGLESHTTRHFPEFGEFYYREDIKELSPYRELPLPSHMWETSEFEPNYLEGELE